MISRVLDEIGFKMLENTVNATINMTTRDTKEGIADLICEILTINRKVRVDRFSFGFRFKVGNLNGVLCCCCRK